MHWVKDTAKDWRLLRMLLCRLQKSCISFYPWRAWAILLIFFIDGTVFMVLFNMNKMCTWAVYSLSLLHSLMLGWVTLMASWLLFQDSFVVVGGNTECSQHSKICCTSATLLLPAPWCCGPGTSGSHWVACTHFLAAPITTAGHQEQALEPPLYPVVNASGFLPIFSLASYRPQTEEEG